MNNRNLLFKMLVSGLTTGLAVAIIQSGLGQLGQYMAENSGLWIGVVLLALIASTHPVVVGAMMVGVVGSVALVVIAWWRWLRD